MMRGMGLAGALLVLAIARPASSAESYFVISQHTINFKPGTVDFAYLSAKLFVHDAGHTLDPRIRLTLASSHDAPADLARVRIDRVFEGLLAAGARREALVVAPLEKTFEKPPPTDAVIIQRSILVGPGMPPPPMTPAPPPPPPSDSMPSKVETHDH